MGTLKTQLGIFCCFFTLLWTISSSSLGAVQKASIVICAETGKIYHEQNADALTPPASLAKMMTFYLTFKALREGKLTINQKLPVSKHASQAQPSKLWLKPGSTITVHEALRGMATKSANDATIALAEKLGGSEAQFAVLMTREAQRLGMPNTIFRNCHGLPRKLHNITTAREMAILACSLYKHFPEYFKYFKDPQFAYKGTVHKNHNHLLGKVPGVDGIKTGFICASGFNLAASMVRDNRRIIAIVMGGESIQARDKKMAKLLEATYASISGKKGTGHNSINDLLCSIGSSDVKGSLRKGKLHKAVGKPHTRPVKVLKTKYSSVDDILEQTSKPKKKPQTPKKKTKKKVKKSSSNKIRTVKRKKNKV